MSYRIENKDIVIDGWENGIADSPHLGIANMRSVNLDTPGEVAVNFKTTAMTIPPTVSAVAFTAVGATDVLTVASTSGWYNGMAVTLPSVGATGLSNSRVYWVGDLSGLTFKLYKTPNRAVTALDDVTGDGSGTLTSYTLGAPIDKATENNNGPGNNLSVILDDNGRLWWVETDATGAKTGALIYLGNDTLTGTTGRAVTMFKNYIIVFRTSTVDALITTAIANSVDLDGGSGWTYGWESISTSDETPRPVLVGQDDVMYYDNSTRIGSINENAGSSFDPTSGATYTENTTALDLPNGKEVSSLGELGTDLLVGTVTNKIYPWDRVSPSFNIPLDVPELRTSKIISVNNIAYIFAGLRGRIYRTSGSSVELWKKIPDHITGKFSPYFTWKDVEVSRGKLFFSFICDENDGTDITTLGGVWSIDLNTEAFTHSNQLTHGNGGTTGVILKMELGASLINLQPGNGLYIGWTNSAGTSFGVDYGSSSPYSSYETIIETEIIPIGTYTFKETPSQIEYKLSRLLVSGEAVRISFRTDLSDTYETIFTSSTAGTISDANDITFENAEWVQFKIELSSTATTPSNVPLKELRLRL